MPSIAGLPSEKPAVVAGRLAALIVGLAIALRATVDPDLWGHLRFGLDVLDGKGLPLVDPYSFTQDVPWINHEWLSEVCYAVAFTIGGVTGLIAFKALVLGSAMLVMARLTRDVEPEYRWWLLAITFLNLAPIATAFRPQLWTILGVPLVCLVLMTRRFAWLPLIFAVWANMHGGWIVGGSILAAWVVGRLIATRDLRDVLPAVGFGALSFLATAVNPYGWRMWEFLSGTVRMSRPDITEWQPYWAAFQPEHGLLYPLALATFVVTTVARWRQISWARWLPAVWLAYSGLMVGRVAPFFAVAALFCAAEAWTRSGARVEIPPAVPVVRYRWLIDAAAALAVVLPTFAANTSCLTVDGEWAPDLVAAGAFDEPSVNGRLVVPFNWGEYAIWHYGPRLRVSMDGRRETVYSAATVAEQTELAHSTSSGLQFVSRVKPEYVWLPGLAPNAASEWLSNNGYRVDVTTAASFIATRSELPVLAKGIPHVACFP